jgi:class 3 adenylate cyclase
MKRSLLHALVIGLVVGAIVMGLHASGLLLRPELAVSDLFSRHDPATKSIGDKYQYGLVFLAAAGIAWMTLLTSQRSWLGWIVLVLVVELLGVAWIGSLYHVFFPPLPSIEAAALGFLVPLGWLAFLERRGSRDPAVVLSDRISGEQLDQVKTGAVPIGSAAKVYEVTAVVCDIANKHDVAEECEPAAFAEMTEKFIAHATATFKAAGAYIESADGEGVVAIFGFPAHDPKHAEAATRNAMALTRSGDSKAPANIAVHAGVSSGKMVMAPFKKSGQTSMLATGEPVELARRFCIANRFYGSRVLLGPRTFELASKILVARPIDFLSGVDVRERHEIYEPVTLALDASPDQITRRDAFWNGVVLYREKRWAEAYGYFQKARNPQGDEDRPLQLYLHRLELLVLQLTETPVDQ